MNDPLLTLHLPGEVAPSWNRFFAGEHWTERRALAADAKIVVRDAVPLDLPPITVPVFLRYDATFTTHVLDPDNIMAKPYTDGLVAAGVLDGDDWRRVRGVAVYSHKGKEPGIIITIYEADTNAKLTN